MASNTLSGDLISERYGAALYDLASEKKCIDDILNDFGLVQKALKESSELRQVIKSPLVNSDENTAMSLTPCRPLTSAPNVADRESMLPPT